METKEAIGQLKADLADIKTQGHSTVTIEALEKYLEGLEQDAYVSTEMRKLQHQSSLAQYEAQAQSNIEMFKSVIEAGKDALRTTILINGGAVVAFLGFLGSMLSKGGAEALGLKLTVPLLCFGSGVLLGALGFGIRYCTQYAYQKEWTKAGHTLNVTSVLFATCSYTVFGAGIYLAYLAFSSHFRH